MRRAWPSLAAAAIVLLTAAFIGRACLWRNDIGFLVERPPASWILYPTPPFAGIRPGVPLDAVFRKSFTLESVPPTAELRVRAYRSCAIELNGQPVSDGLDSKHWKRESRFDVARFLRAGRNDIAVTVANASGPPALWLALSHPAGVLASDDSWEASWAGATWLPAVRASDPRPVGNVDRDGIAERVGPSLLKVWPTWLVFAAVSLACVLLCSRWLAAGESGGSECSRRRWIRLTGFLFIALAALWVAMFLHNSDYLSPHAGFDAKGRLSYINHFRTAWSVPMPGEGWQTHHPPLYYFLAGVLLRVARFAPDTPLGILVIRLFNLAVGLTHLAAILACLRLIFPEHPRRWLLGLLFAGTLPMGVYLHHYALNHILGGALASVTLYAVLRLLCKTGTGLRDHILAGAALGLALLSAIHEVLLVLPVGVALVAKLCLDRGHRPWPRAAGRLLALAAAAAGLCGWYYLRVWIRCGSPFVANVGAGVGSPFAYWQDSGFRTAGDFLRFGEALRSPLFSAWYGVWDGFYSTLWGDSFGGGTASLLSRPPWSYDHMAAGMLLALAPTAALLAAGCIALYEFLRRPTVVWSFLLLTAFTVVAFLVYSNVVAPHYSTAKSFYGLATAVPLVAMVARGLDALAGRGARLRGAVFVFLGVWTLNAAATYWIAPHSVDVRREAAASLVAGGNMAEAAGRLERLLADHPDDTRSRVLLAEVCLNGGFTSRAEAMLELPAGQRDLPWRHVVLSHIADRAGRSGEVLDELQKAVELAPDDLKIARARAAAVSRYLDAPPAIPAWQNVLRIHPYDREAHAALARLYDETNDPASARRHRECVNRLQLSGW